MTHLKPVGQSLLGLDPDRGRLLVFFNLALAYKPSTLYSVTLAARIYQELPDPGQTTSANLAVQLVNATRLTLAPKQLHELMDLLIGLGAGVLPAQAEAVAQLLVAAMVATTSSGDFVTLAQTLGKLPVLEDHAALNSAIDLLQAPMAYGDTRKQLLRYYSRLAGLIKDADTPASKQELVAWLKAHREDLDLSRAPRNPFR